MRPLYEERFNEGYLEGCEFAYHVQDQTNIGKLAFEDRFGESYNVGKRRGYDQAMAHAERPTSREPFFEAARELGMRPVERRDRRAS